MLHKDEYAPERAALARVAGLTERQQAWIRNPAIPIESARFEISKLRAEAPKPEPDDDSDKPKDAIRALLCGKGGLLSRDPKARRKAMRALKAYEGDVSDDKPSASHAVVASEAARIRSLNAVDPLGRSLDVLMGLAPAPSRSAVGEDYLVLQGDASAVIASDSAKVNHALDATFDAACGRHPQPAIPQTDDHYSLGAS
jgi:hypothetical protein